MAEHLPSQIKSYETFPNSEHRRWSPQKHKSLIPRPEGGNTETRARAQKRSEGRTTE